MSDLGPIGREVESSQERTQEIDFPRNHGSLDSYRVLAGDRLPLQFLPSDHADAEHRMLGLSIRW